MLLSIVLPCYNEEQVLPETVKRLQDMVSLLQNTYTDPVRTTNSSIKSNTYMGEGIEVELLFVNDGSTDKTFELLLQFQSRYSNIRIINFARNFGHQTAVTAGMDASNGDAVVLMDSDLQDPPEVVLKMFALWLEGYDVIYATKTSRSGVNKLKKTAYFLFYRILNILSDTPIPLDTGDFRLMDRKIVDTLNAMPERERFIRGMVSWVGFKQIALPYARPGRFAGKSKYTFAKLVSLAMSGILSFSIKPLKLASLLGLFSSGIAILGFLYALYTKLIMGTIISGWTSIILSIMFVGGVQLFCTGVLGEYVGRIYKHVKERPMYIVEGYYGYTKDTPRLIRSPVSNVSSEHEKQHDEKC